MSKLTDTGLNRAIASLEPAQLAALYRRAMDRVQTQFNALVEQGDFNGARSLIERMHLITGDRRTKHIAPPDGAPLRRQDDR